MKYILYIIVKKKKENIYLLLAFGALDVRIYYCCPNCPCALLLLEQPGGYMRMPSLSVEDSLSTDNIGNITTPPKSVFMALLW